VPVQAQQSTGKLLYLLVVAAGLSLTPLLFIGTFFDISSPLFALSGAVHILILVAAVVAALLLVIKTFFNLGVGMRLVIVAGLAALFVGLLETTLPVVYKDALIHHLAIAQWWVSRGEIYSPQWHEWSYYPMLLNLGFAVLYSWNIGELSGLYHWAYGALTAVVLLGGTARILSSQSAGAIAFFLAATTPIFFRILSVPLVDCGLALFSAVAFFGVMEAQSLSESAEARRRILTIAAISLGLALSTKYNALVLSVSLFLLYPLFASQRSFRQILREMVYVVTISLVVYAPWLARNYHLTNNPIYPLYSNIFKPNVERPSGLPSLKPLAQRILIYGESPLEIAFLPIRVFFEGADESPAKFDGVLSPVLMSGVVAGLVYFSHPALRASLLLCVLYSMLAILSNPLRIRYLVPLIAPLMVLNAYAITKLLTAEAFKRFAGVALLVVHFLFFGVYAFHKIEREQLVPYIRGQIGSDQYLAQRIPEYPMISYMNEHLPSDSKVYLLFTGNRFSLYKPLVFSGGHFSASYLLDWIRSSARTGAPLTQRFAERHIQYILAESLRAQTFAIEQLAPEEREVWIDFLTHHLDFIREERGYSLWKIKA
jgi:hypothetical protein